MIERHWKGIAKAKEEENYIQHLGQHTFPQIAGIRGFIKASVLKRVVTDGTEFLVITVWDSAEAISLFAGEPADIAVVPEVVKQMMTTYDKTVLHYQAASSYVAKLSSAE